ncbi:MAG: hypothetical protein WBD30_03190 [Bacteroidota bacterium]
MNQDANKLVLQIVRYGLPLTVLIFYVTASRSIAYAPESTYVYLWYAGDFLQGSGLAGPEWAGFGGTPSPLWVTFISGGGRLELDLLLTARIFSLFFSCVALLLTFLVAVELLSSRIMALCATLVVAVNPWLLQMAPSGGAGAIGLVLSLAAVFFHLRGERILSVTFSGLCTLVCWQAFALFVFLLLHGILLASPGRRSPRIVVGPLLVYTATVLPWIAVGMLAGAGLLPVSVGETAAMSWPGVIAWILLLALATAGILSEGVPGEGVRGFLVAHGMVVAWVLWLLVLEFGRSRELLLFAYPIVVIYGFLGLRRLVRGLYAGEAPHYPLFVATALLMLANQTGYHLYVKPGMSKSVATVNALAAIAGWMRTETNRETSVRSEVPWTLSYLSQRQVEPIASGSLRPVELVVTSEKEVGGFTEVYRPALELLRDAKGGGGRYAVWRRTDTIIEEVP